MKKQRWEESEKRRGEERRSEQRKSQKKEDAGARKGSKVETHCFSKVKKLKTFQVRSTFGCWDIEKVHAAVAWSTFPSQIVQITPTSHTNVGPFLEVVMSKKCRLLWREVRVQIKMRKAHHARTTFGSWHVEKVHAVVARSTFPSQKCKKLRGTEHFWTFRCCFAWQAQGFRTLPKVRKTWGFCSSFNYNHHYSKLHSTPLHYTTTTITITTTTTLHYTNYITLHYATLHWITLHYSKLHYTNYNYSYNYNYTTLHYPTLLTLHYITLHFTSPHNTTLHSTTLHYNYSYNYNDYITLLELFYTTLHDTTPHYTTPHCTTPHYTTQHNTTLTTTTATSTTTLGYTTLDYTTLPYITLHYTHYTTTNATATTLR